MSPVDRPPTFDRSVAADVRLLVTLRAELRAWLVAHDVASEDCDAIVLASSEALANAIEHAYRGDPTGVVRISGCLRGEVVEVAVSDRGSWVPPQVNRGPSYDGSMPLGEVRGRGLPLIRQLMDRTEVSTNGGTTVSMRRRVARP